MKYLTVVALLVSFPIYAQNFSPSASGSSISSPAGTVGPGTVPSVNPSVQAESTFNPVTPSSSFNSAPVDVGTVPNSNFNTAPTTVPTGQPSDTTLLNNGTNTVIPSNNPIQAQEFDDASFGTGSGSGPSTGSGANPNLNNGAFPITSP